MKAKKEDKEEKNEENKQASGMAQAHMYAALNYQQKQAQYS